MNDENVIAQDVWGIRSKGKAKQVRVYVLRPEPAPGDKNKDWRCGVFVEGTMKRVTFAMGVGPVDALMNASRLLMSIWEELGGAAAAIAPRAKKR